MNALFMGGDNWYPAIVGSKAVAVRVREEQIFSFLITDTDEVYEQIADKTTHRHQLADKF